MTGFYLLFVTGLWLAIVIWLSISVTKKSPKTRWRKLVGLLVVVVLLPLPLIDEIVGGRQFEQLCKENSTIQVDPAKAVGRTVYLAKTPDVDIKGTWVRIVMKPWRFVDSTTGETILSYNTLMASGGRFIGTLGISEGGAPLTFKGWCEPGGIVDPVKLFKNLGMTQIQRQAKLEESK